MTSGHECPVCHATDPHCAFCLGLGTVTGAWRENLAELQHEGSWTAKTSTDRGILKRVVRHEDIR